MYGGWGEAGNSRNPDELLIEVQFFQAFMELKQIILIDVFFSLYKANYLGLNFSQLVN